MNAERAVLDRASLDEAATTALAGRNVDLQAVWALAAQQRRVRRRRAVRKVSGVLVAAAAAVMLLAQLSSGLDLSRPAPADVPNRPGTIPSRVGIAPPWTPVITDRPIGRVALVLSGSQSEAAEAGGSSEGIDAITDSLPRTPVLVGADPAGGGEQYRLLPEGDLFETLIAVSPDGAWVAWRRDTDLRKAPGQVAVLRVSTGAMHTVELPGSWRRGVSAGALTFSRDGGELRIRGTDRMEYTGGGPDRAWSVAIGDGSVPGGEVGPVRECGCRPDDIPWPLYVGVDDKPLLPQVQTPPAVHVVAFASAVAAAGTDGPEAVPGQAWHDPDWYPWVLRKPVDLLAGHLRLVLVVALLLGAFLAARRWGQAAHLPRTAAGKATARWGARAVLTAVALGIVSVIALKVVAGVGLGLPEPTSPSGVGAVVPRVIGAPPSKLEPAFTKEGVPKTTRVSMVTRVYDGPLVGLDAATGVWVSLSDVPGLGQALTYDGSWNPLAVSPNGRFVLRAGLLEGGEQEPTVVIDLQEARVHRLVLPFGSDPAEERTASLDKAAVLDDGTVAIVRGNLGALWIVPMDGAPREITSVGDVDSVGAQPGGWLLIRRPRTGEDIPRIDLFDVAKGRVWVAATDIGGPEVVASMGDGAVLAWQDEEQGRRPVGLPGSKGKTVEDGTWSAPGGVEALWPSEEGMLIGLGWSALGVDTLLRADSGIDGSTGLRPFAAFERADDEPAMVVSVAGSVVARAELVDPPSQPWWGRLAWRVIDRF